MSWSVALCALAFFYVFPYQPALNNPNENVRFYMTAAIAETGRYNIDAIRARWGWVNDAAVHGGHIWSVKAPGTSLLGVPGYLLYLHLSRITGHPFSRVQALWVCRATASIIPALVFAAVLWHWLHARATHSFARNAVFYSVMLGSLLYGYGMLFVSHTVCAAVSFGAFMWLYNVRNQSCRPNAISTLLVGILIGSATCFEYPGIVVSLVLAVYGAFVLRTPPRLCALALGALLPLLLVMHFQWTAFGHPFRTGHVYLETTGYRDTFVQSALGMGLPTKRALYGLLLDPGAGLLPLTPILFLSGPGFWLLLRDSKQRPDAIAALAIVALTVLTIASSAIWRGGWTIGPRYLAVCVPFLAWPALIGLEALARRALAIARGFALGATAVSLFASGLPSAYYPHVPPEIARPLPQLFSILVSHGYAPMNAGGVLGIYGAVSMLPLLMVAICALVQCARADQTCSGAERVGLRTWLIALIFAAALCAPIWIWRPNNSADAEKIASITRRFQPAGHDAAALLRAELAKQAKPAPRDVARLARLYREEGREGEAMEAELLGVEAKPAR